MGAALFRNLGLVVLLMGLAAGCASPRGGMEAVSHPVVFDNFGPERMEALDERLRTLPGFVSLRSDPGGMSTAHHHEYIVRARSDIQRVKRHLLESLEALSLKGFVVVSGDRLIVKQVTVAKERGR